MSGMSPDQRRALRKAQIWGLLALVATVSALLLFHQRVIAEVSAGIGMIAAVIGLTFVNESED